jgi:hypothetical protein
MPRWTEIITMPNGTRGFVCFSGKRHRAPRCRCGAASSLLCDWPLLDGKTCDRPLCRRCAVPVGRDRDYCREHPT